MPDNKMNPDRILSRFLDEIVAVKGAGLAKSERLSLRQELRSEMEEAMNKAVIAALSEDKLVELDKMMDAGVSEDEIESFFENAGVDFDKVAVSAMLQFRKDKIGEAGAVKDVAAEASEPSDAKAVSDAKVGDELSHDMTQNTNANNASTQGVAPGMSNVEGIARMVAEVSEGGENA